MAKKNETATSDKTGVIIGFLGMVRPQDGKPGWRRNMSLIEHHKKLLESANIKRLEKMVLFLQPPIVTEKDAEEFKRQANAAIWGLDIDFKDLNIKNEDFWDYTQVNAALVRFMDDFEFCPDKHHYFVYTGAGTHVARMCMYWLLDKGFWQGDIVVTITAKDSEMFGEIDIIKMDDIKNSLCEAIEKRSERVRKDFANALHTEDKVFKCVIDEIEASAVRAKDNVLLQGKTGTGKTELAKLIYERRKKGKLLDSDKFITVNCAAITGELAKSELFGHEAGAFTGAIKKYKGKLKDADGGILFLDEIGDLDADAQAMLLKAIEEKEFTPLGGDNTKPVKSDFQLICATNKDLFEEVAQKRFRNDLLKRINVWTFKLPDFAGRRGDMESLLDAVLEDRRDQANGLPVFEPQARKEFLDFACSNEALWTGNYRDMRNAVARLATLSGEKQVTKALVEKEIERLKDEWARERLKYMEDTYLADKVLGEESLKYNRLERAELSCVIEVCRRHRTQTGAAKELYGRPGPDPSKSNKSSKLSKLLEKYNLDFKRLKEKLNAEIA